MTRRSILLSVRASLWFVPVLLFALSIAAALVLVQLDLWLDANGIIGLPDTLAADAEGARQILSVIASSTITVAGVIFSITIVTLSLAAAQYSPRVLRSFMRDRTNQTVLGVLVGVFTYALLVMRAIRSGDAPFVPQLALWFGILLMLVGLASIILFIHNTAVSIQAPEIVARISSETIEALDEVRNLAHEDRDAEALRELPDNAEIRDLKWEGVPATQSGYVQDVALKALFDLACEHDLVLRVDRVVGDFAVEGRPLISVTAPEQVPRDVRKELVEQFGISSYRAVDQDPSFGIRQLVDIALKALSPSMNDTTTAIHCIDHLGVVLHHAVRGPDLPQTHRYGGRLRLILKRPGNARFFDLAFNEIRQSAGGNVAVLLRLFRVLRELRETITDLELQRELRRHIELISANIERHVPCESDRRALLTSKRRSLAATPIDV
ncbi:DUF2254 domain-containing protein [Gilvimarinus sp. F26214L]|uniref:DUF2254 domain-containing protein n=1 Tax=Gilvimarinus sp. DZF01 TaxID=3461371 RepID=UPI004045F8C2